ncbi:hypothetical protein QFZ23_000359 [Arthrobacter globiformis]|nr:hypothetical protein [Arthrobacter globiformis]
MAETTTDGLMAELAALEDLKMRAVNRNWTPCCARPGPPRCMTGW